MQVMWTTGPLGKLHTVSMRTRRVAVSLAAAATLLVVAGIGLSILAFKLAFDYDPALVASIGGVLTRSEAERRESTYRSTLEALHEELAAAQQQLGQLQALKEEFSRLASPRGTRAAGERRTKPGQGGPHLALEAPSADAAVPLHERLASARLRIEGLNRSLERTRLDWRRELERLERIPNARPLEDLSGLSSRYGVRMDPFTGSPARHEGIDIAAPAGTPILATAAGRVARVANDPQYGRMIDLDHGNGYVTRYAHARSIDVREGQRVVRGARLGAVGSTGRSTGPHLHYEVRLHNRPQNPLDYGLSDD